MRNLLLFGSAMALSLAVGCHSQVEAAASTGYLEPPGSTVVDLSACTGTYGNTPALGGNATSPVLAWEGTTYAAWVSEDGKPVVATWDGTDCTTPVNVDTSGFENPGSHDTPSIFMDGEGYLYVTYFGARIYDDRASLTDRPGAPFIRRSVNPYDASEWGDPERARLWNYSETHGQQLNDGSVLLVGADMPARMDIIEPGGDYRWPAARQIVAQDRSRSANPEGCQSSGPSLNRFTKAIVHQGPDDTLYTTWGWGSGYAERDRPYGLCMDIHHYSADSHEVFFAYSTDDGLNWTNLDGTKTVPSVLCTRREVCEEPNAGITHNDPAFKITTQRQRFNRNLWIDEDETIYIAFAQSTWCDAGVCNQPKPTATTPGALTLLKFKLEGSVEQRVVNSDAHHHIGGVRTDSGKLYIWAQDERWSDFYEYVSEDKGETWSRTQVTKDGSGTSGGRLHGGMAFPNLNPVHLLFDNSARPRNVYLYKRVFKE